MPEDLLDEVARDLEAWDGSSNISDHAPRPVAVPPPRLQPPPDPGNESDGEPLLPEAVEHTLGEMKKALERAKRKLDKSRAHVASLSAELEQTKAVIPYEAAVSNAVRHGLEPLYNLCTVHGRRTRHASKHAWTTHADM